MPHDHSAEDSVEREVAAAFLRESARLTTRACLLVLAGALIVSTRLIFAVIGAAGPYLSTPVKWGAAALFFAYGGHCVLVVRKRKREGRVAPTDRVTLANYFYSLILAGLCALAARSAFDDYKPLVLATFLFYGFAPWLLARAIRRMEPRIATIQNFAKGGEKPTWEI